MKQLILTSIMLLGLLSQSFAQIPLVNGGFENWTTVDYLVNFPPYYSVSNLSSVFEGADQNVFPVLGENGGTAARFEPNFVDSAVLVAAMTIGEFFPSEAGAPFVGQPDSLRIWLRYHIQPGDNSLLAFTFFEGGNQIGGLQTIFLTGTDSVWHLETFDMPTLPVPTDSIGILIAGGDFANAQLGTWMEIDSMAFTGVSDPIPNAGFSMIDSISFSDPDEWFTANEFFIITGVDPTVTKVTDAYEGNYAVKVESRELDFGNGSDTVGFLFYAQEIGDEGPFGGYPVPQGAESPKRLSGYYQYHPVGQDTAIAYLVMTAYDNVNNKRDTVGMYGIPLPEALAYTAFHIETPLIAAADSFVLAFGSSDFDGTIGQSEVGIGSYLLLDALTFDTTSLTDGILDEVEQISASLYPIPTDRYLTVRTSEVQAEELEIRIFNLHGKLVKNESWRGNMSVTLDLNELPAGYYLFNMKTASGDRQFSRKILKQ